MTVKELLLDAAFNAKILENRSDFGFIPEAEPIINGGSAQIFEAVSDTAKAAGEYHSEVVARACRYLFGKAAEAVILWGGASNGKFTLFFNSAAISSEDVFKDLPADYKDKVRATEGLADTLFDAHTKWLNDHKQELAKVKLGDEIKELLTWCARIGMAYALEHKFQELPGGAKGAVSHGVNLNAEALEAAQKGAELVQAKEYAKAIPLLLKAAEAGHAPAQYGLAMMHYRGLGTPQSCEKALAWFLKAAELGLAQAQHEASVFLFNGVGCKAAPVKAFALAQQAAAQNHPGALFNVGLFYMNGIATPKDTVNGLAHISAAADLGHPEAIKAMKELGDKSR